MTSPTQLGVKRGDRVTLYHESGAIEWERVDIADAVLLHALRDHPLDKKLVYEIIRQSDGKLGIQVSSQKNLIRKA